MKIKITADSTCDLAPRQVQAQQIEIMPLFVNKGNESFLDGVSITPTDIFAHVAAGGALCTTAAVPVGYYQERFAALSQAYDAVIHVSLGSGFSATHHNALLAAAEFPHVRVVDSRNLSTGHGHVVLEACRLAETVTELGELDAICAKLDAFAARVDTSFLLDRLDYMVKGGRCSSVVALGANLLNLKPCIEVVNNKMIIGKKYRGNYAKCMERYVRDRLAQADRLDDRLIFITHTPVSAQVLEAVHRTVDEVGHFRQVVETTAGGTISCHCGEGCLGILFVHQEEA